jgi:hypothetical protein
MTQSALEGDECVRVHVCVCEWAAYMATSRVDTVAGYAIPHTVLMPP